MNCRRKQSLCQRFFAIRLPVLALPLMFATTCFAAQRRIDWTLPPGTAIPVEFTRTIKADKARAEDQVKAETMQVVHLGQGHDLPKGSIVLGQVITARPLRGDVDPSILAFKFDRIVTRAGVLHVHLYVRALANVDDSSAASVPTPPSDMNLSDSRTLIDGDQVIPSERKIYSSEDKEGPVLGENLKDGVFERLRPALAVNQGKQLLCDGTATEQSVAIYSGSACGLYGFGTAYLAHRGKRNQGVVEMDARYFTVRLYSQSTALLQVAPNSDASKP
jgi:hypothetical protein